MRKIFVTGDVHHKLSVSKFNNESLNHSGVSTGDIMFIAGDFGFPWGGKKKQEDEYWLDWLQEKLCTFVVVPGNHENYDLLETYPVVEWKGAKAWQLRKNIFVIHRGEIVTIDGKTFFCMGGAYSIDKAFRTIGVSWWEQELPTREEYDNALKNLGEAKFKVDYIITHTAPIRAFEESIQTRTVKPIGELEMFLDSVADSVEFKHWFFGHFHHDYRMSDKFTVIYEYIEEIGS